MAVTQKLSDVATVDNADAIVLVSGNPIFASKIANGTNIKAGLIVITTANAYDVNPAAIAGASGVALDLPYVDIDTDFDDNAPIRMARLGSSCVCRTFMGTEGDATVEEGALAWLSDDASGYWLPTHVSAHISAGTPGTPAILAAIVGRNAKRITTTDGDTMIAHLLLSV